MVLISITARGYHNFLWNTFSLAIGLHCQVCTTLKCLRKDIIRSCSYLVKAVYLFYFHAMFLLLVFFLIVLLCSVEMKGKNSEKRAWRCWSWESLLTLLNKR